MRTVTVSLCTGINETENSVSALLYPNPFKDQLTIKDFSGQVKIYNQLGELLIELSIKEELTINTSELLPAIYIIKTHSAAGEERAYKLVKE
jgi:hypothetical protein